MRIKEGESFRDTWFGTAIFEGRDRIEERIIWLRLPIFGMAYNIAYDEYRWGQRVLLYRGRHGFSFRWRFPVQRA